MPGRAAAPAPVAVPAETGETEVGEVRAV
jgi:hypothetical protein